MQNPDAWFQAYLPGDQTRIDRLTDRVANAGFRTLVVTADTPVLGNREHNTRSGFSMPMRITPRVAWQSAMHPRWLLTTVAQTFYRHGIPHFENMEADRGPPMLSRNALRNTTARDRLSWDNLRAIRKRWKGVLLVKGLTNPADVEIARTCGVEGVILSTHGGRQLDYEVPPLEMLPRVAARKGDLTVIIDSGVRRGTDIVKALALGADAVLLGRPFMFAAAIGGAPGVLSRRPHSQGGGGARHGACRREPPYRAVARHAASHVRPGLTGMSETIHFKSALVVKGAFDTVVSSAFERMSGLRLNIDWARDDDHPGKSGQRRDGRHRA